MKDKEKEVRYFKIVKELSIICFSLKRLNKLECGLDIVSDSICLVDRKIQIPMIDDYQNHGKYRGDIFDQSKYIIHSFSNN